MTIRKRSGKVLLSGVLAFATVMPLLWRGVPAIAQASSAAQTAIADTVQYADGSAAQGPSC